MRDGYYLSTYLHIDEIAHLADLRVRHDQNISLWQKIGDEIKLVHYWELERITGLKRHSKSFYNTVQARQLIDQLLKRYSLTIEDMVEVWGTPELAKNDDYHSLDSYKDLSYHSIAHLFSTIASDSENLYNEDIIGLAVDGGPDGVVDQYISQKKYYSGCFSRKGEVDVFPVYSPGFIWTYAKKHFNLREGTLMALATASTSQLITEKEDEIVLVDSVEDLPKAYKYVKNLAAKIDLISEKDTGKLFNGFDSRFTIKENKISMVMKEIQKMSIRIMEKNIESIIEKYKIDPANTYLALSGGYVLNCPTNSYLMKKYKFKGFMAPPCVSDTGLSLGIALYAFYKKMSIYKFKLKNAFYGNSDETLEKIIESKDYDKFIKSISRLDYKKAVEDIKESAIVWFNEASEIGPRALGHRSIIADPRTNEAKEQLNQIKQRQWWRPVAPIIAQDAINEWFEDIYPSPFMLHTFQIKPEKLENIPAVAHLDNSARVQTVNKVEAPVLYELINAFREVTGVPILCNTSLNDRGEPIIDRIEEALNLALRKKIKVMYINGKRVELKNHNEYLNQNPIERVIDISIYDNEDEKQKMMLEHNPFNISREILMFYFHRPELRDKFDLKNEEDVRKLKIYAKVAHEKMGLSVVPGV